LAAGFIAGTLDILAAIFFLAGGNASGVFRYIAHAAVGDTAYQRDIKMVVVGAVFHYFIAYCFTAGYFIFYPHIPFLRKHVVVSGLLYGIFIWSFMHFLVLPLTHNPPAPFSLANDWKNIVILMLAVGLPVAVMARTSSFLPQGHRGH
jgi:hypothetical protein